MTELLERVEVRLQRLLVLVQMRVTQGHPPFFMFFNVVEFATTKEPLWGKFCCTDNVYRPHLIATSLQQR